MSIQTLSFAVHRGLPRWWRRAAVPAALLASLTGLASCTDSKCENAADCDGESSGYGAAALGLGDSVSGIQGFRLRLFRGPVVKPDQQAAYVLASCAPFVGADGKPLASFQLRDVPARKDYSVVLDLFTDAGCTLRKYRGYRGGISIVAGKTPTNTPYHIPLVELGAFSPMVEVAPNLQADARARVCSSDSDCKTVHPNATCASDNLCEVDHLFPLNGGQRRGLPQSVAMTDGRVAVTGGVTVLTGTAPDRYWAGTAGSTAGQLLEVYEPTLGIFSAKQITTDDAPLALGSASPTQDGLWLAGGVRSLQISGAPGALQLALDARQCQTTSASCAVSRGVARWSVTAGLSQRATLNAPLALPIVHPVLTTSGERLLVAGGASLPIEAFDPRSGSAVLCASTTSGVDCSTATKNGMQLGRANAAVGCLSKDASGACNKVLILGGLRNPGSGSLAEVFDGATESFAVATVSGGPASLQGGELKPVSAGKFLLVGASQKRLWLEDTTPGGADLPPYLVSVTDSGGAVSVTMTAVTGASERLLPAVAQLADGSVLLMGGLDKNQQVLADAQLIAPDGKAGASIPLTFGRFGATAQRIGGEGPTGGCILLAGGFFADTAGVRPENRVELFCPLAAN